MGPKCQIRLQEMVACVFVCVRAGWSQRRGEERDGAPPPGLAD